MSSQDKTKTKEDHKKTGEEEEGKKKNRRNETKTITQRTRKAVC
jgi:hypothetical protein